MDLLTGKVGGGRFQPKPKETQRSEVHALNSSASFPHVTNEMPSCGGDWNSSYVKSAEEVCYIILISLIPIAFQCLIFTCYINDIISLQQNKGVISHLESIDDLPTQSLNKEGKRKATFSLVLLRYHFILFFANRWCHKLHSQGKHLVISMKGMKCYLHFQTMLKGKVRFYHQKGQLLRLPLI